jgi:phosphoribosylformylglycinamidine (FGAM) synthase PurS component
MEENNNISQTLLMKQILDGISVLKSTMPNGELKHLQDSVEGLRLDQKSLKEDVSDIKRKLLDPDGGVIVKVNENTKFRVQEESRYEDYLQFNMDLNDLKKWQSGINKAMWIIFTAIAAIALKVIFSVG